MVEERFGGVRGVGLVAHRPAHRVRVRVPNVRRRRHESAGLRVHGLQVHGLLVHSLLVHSLLVPGGLLVHGLVALGRVEPRPRLLPLLMQARARWRPHGDDVIARDGEVHVAADEPLARHRHPLQIVGQRRNAALPDDQPRRFAAGGIVVDHTEAILCAKGLLARGPEVAGAAAHVMLPCDGAIQLLGKPEHARRLHIQFTVSAGAAELVAQHVAATGAHEVGVTATALIILDEAAPAFWRLVRLPLIPHHVVRGWQPLHRQGVLLMEERSRRSSIGLSPLGSALRLRGAWKS